MTKNNTETMRKYLTLLESDTVEEQNLEEGPKWNAIKGVVGSVFGKLLEPKDMPWVQKAMLPYLRYFEATMKQYRQDYSTVTWSMLTNFLIRNRISSKLDLGGGHRGAPLTKEDVVGILTDDRQTLITILGKMGINNPKNYLPTNSGVFAAPWSNKKIGEPIPLPPQPVTTIKEKAEIIVSAILEAAIIFMIEKSEKIHEPASQPGQPPSAQTQNQPPSAQTQGQPPSAQTQGQAPQSPAPLPSSAVTSPTMTQLAAALGITP